MKKMNTKLSDKYLQYLRLADYFTFDVKPYLSMVTFEADEMIIKEGEKLQKFYYLIVGRAKLFLNREKDKRPLIHFLDAPCVLGEMELLDKTKMAQGVKAVTTCICCAIDINQCREQILTDVKFLRHLCLFLSKKATQNIWNNTKSQTYPLSVRLAAFILSTSNHGFYREKHAEVAEFLGVSERHLMYVLSDFVNKGILSRQTHGYRIRDIARLQDLASNMRELYD